MLLYSPLAGWRITVLLKLPVSLVRLLDARESNAGWIACVLRDGRARIERGLLSMRDFLYATKNCPHPESL
jgi:hypothetical protein